VVQMGKERSYSTIIRIMPLDTLTEKEREWLDRVAKAHPEWAKQSRAVFEVDTGNGKTRIVAPIAPELQPDVDVVSTGSWSTFIQTVGFLEPGKTSFSSLAADDRLSPVAGTS